MKTITSWKKKVENDNSNKQRVAEIHTNLSAEALNPRDEDIRRKEPPHSLAAIDRELPAVQILVDIGGVGMAQSHDWHVPFNYAVVVADEAVAVDSRFGDEVADPMLLNRRCCG